MNKEKFNSLKKLHLPVHEYAITGGGPLGIRNLRTIGDIDIIVTSELWDSLAGEYGVSRVDGVEKIIFPDGVIEAFREGSFGTIDPNVPTVAERIAQAEIIEGLPFDRIDTVLYYKRKGGREKDLQDVRLIEKWLLTQ